MSWTLSTSGAAIFKAGEGANTTATLSGSIMDKWSDEAEGQIATITRKDWVADYAGVTTNFKPVLDDAVSDIVAMRIIMYDMGGYTSRFEAQTMLDILHDNLNRNLRVLKEQEHQEVMD